jgi:hypothetical protein
VKPSLSSLNKFTPTLYLLKIQFNIILPSTPRSPGLYVSEINNVQLTVYLTVSIQYETKLANAVDPSLLLQQYVCGLKLEAELPVSRELLDVPSREVQSRWTSVSREPVVSHVSYELSACFSVFGTYG